MAFKSHDVRRMAACIFCGQVGIYKPDTLPIPTLLRIYESPKPKQTPHQYVHPRCVVRRNGLEALLRLPTEELGEICMGDIPMRQLKAVGTELTRRRDSAAKAVKKLKASAPKGEQ